MATTRQLAKIIKDSVSPEGVRLTTLEIELPRIVLAEFNTHRVMSRCSASSRAIPVKKMLARAKQDPYIPETWGKNGKGMQAKEVLTGESADAARAAWLLARDVAVKSVEHLLEIGIHKQTTNRVLEPWMWHTIIVTATEWSNFFNLRNHPLAHPAIANTAAAMQAAVQASEPTPLMLGQWHLPYIDAQDDGLALADKLKVSTSRCARVSYLTHGDSKRDHAKDITLHDDKLLTPGHMSPFEHPARPMAKVDVTQALAKLKGVTIWNDTVDPAEHFQGNFRGWVQYRKTIPGEADILGHRKANT